jgi:hypothetical protein
VAVHLVDGRRGDEDGLANGAILDPAAIVIRHFTSPAQAFVTALYELVLQREPSTDELSRGMQRLAAGGSRLGLARAVWELPEHRGLEVNRIYGTYLDRVPDAAGAAFWVRALGRGVGETRVAQALLTSSEYRRSHPTLRSFVSGLEADVLGRTAGPSDPLHRRLLRLGSRAGRAALARAALASPDAAARLLTGDDETLLGRAARPGEVRRASVWLGSLSTAQAAIAERILASKDFLDHASAISPHTTTRPGARRSRSVP